MKKLVLILFVFTTSTLSILASVEKEALGGVNIRLSCSYVHHDPIAVPVGRAPMRVPTVNLTGNILTIPYSLIGYEMVITSELGDVIFSTETISTEIVIPDNMSGSYQIEFNGDDYSLYGMFSI